MNIETYKRNEQYLVIFPDLPKWLVVDELGAQVANKIAQGNPLDNVLVDFPTNLHQDVKDTYKDITHLLNDLEDRQNFQIVDRALTSRTTIAMISVTKICNLRCPHCYVDSRGLEGPELTLQEHVRLAQDIHDCLATNPNVIYKINLTGGEPFTHPQILDIIKAYRNVGFKVNMSTNTLLIDKRYIKELRNMQVSLMASLDGATPETHEAIRGKGTHKYTAPI